MTIHEKYMHRCLDLATRGAGNVAPNPMVGAVLVYDDVIIGEGYHLQYGGPHAEVNCINSVSENDKKNISRSTMYVSLEPCSHFGKTPPCADLIIEKNIPSVVIGCSDIYKEVSGKGIEKLRQAGISVEVGILEKEAIALNKRFFIFHEKQRPYIILKWAQSANEKIANGDYTSVAISNEQTNKRVHKWRSEEAAILVGTNTARHDNPSLTTRLWEGNNPTRVVIDKKLSLPETLHLFDNSIKTIVFNTIKEEVKGNMSFYKIEDNVDLIEQILNILYHQNIQSIIIEGGTKTLQSFINKGLWDEARIITNQELIIENGIASPIFSSSNIFTTEKILSDKIEFYKN